MLNPASKIKLKRPFQNKNKIDSIFAQINRERDISQGKESDIHSSIHEPDRSKKKLSLDISKLVERANMQQ